MNIGQKIKTARREKKLTQADLSKNIITRNMLCAIENGNATPSLDTLIKIAERLELPVSYLVSENEDMFLYKKSESINKITSALKAKNYKAAIERALSLGKLDDEIAYIVAFSNFKLAESAVKLGSLQSASLYLKEFKNYRKYTVYDLTVEDSLYEIYSAISKNIQAPLLEFNENEYLKVLKTVEYEYCKYLLMDYDYPYTIVAFKNHLKSKQLIRERKYQDAVKLLTEIADNKNPDYDAYLIFGVYTDLETCYKQLYDFENAYRYSSKRMSLLESFKS